MNAPAGFLQAEVQAGRKVQAGAVLSRGSRRSLGVSSLCCAPLPSRPIAKCTRGFCSPGALAPRVDALQRQFASESIDRGWLPSLELTVHRGPQRAPVGTAEGLEEREGWGAGGEQRCCQTPSRTPSVRRPSPGEQFASGSCPLPGAHPSCPCGRLSPKSPLQPVTYSLSTASHSHSPQDLLHHVSWCFLMSRFPEFLSVVSNSPPR